MEGTPQARSDEQYPEESPDHDLIIITPPGDGTFSSPWWEFELQIGDSVTVPGKQAASVVPGLVRRHHPRPGTNQSCRFTLADRSPADSPGSPLGFSRTYWSSRNTTVTVVATSTGSPFNNVGW